MEVQVGVAALPLVFVDPEAGEEVPETKAGICPIIFYFFGPYITVNVNADGVEVVDCFSF